MVENLPDTKPTGRPQLGLKLDSIDEIHVIIDMGLTYTKVGFAKDALPKHIIPTPLSMVNHLRSHLKQTKANAFANLFNKPKKLENEVQEFMATIFYHLLQTDPKSKAVVVIESFMGMRILTEAIGHCCFKKFHCKSVYFVLANVLPLYSTGMDSGIIIDTGFQQA